METKKEHGVDMKEWMRRNSKVKLSQLARPLHVFDSSPSFDPSVEFTALSDQIGIDIDCSQDSVEDNTLRLKGVIVGNPTIDIKTGLK